jgi:hypothetical protein
MAVNHPIVLGLITKSATAGYPARDLPFFSKVFLRQVIRRLTSMHFEVYVDEIPTPSLDPGLKSASRSEAEVVARCDVGERSHWRHGRRVCCETDREPVRLGGLRLAQAIPSSRPSRYAHRCVDKRTTRGDGDWAVLVRPRRVFGMWRGRRLGRQPARSTDLWASAQAAGSCAPLDAGTTPPKRLPRCRPDRERQRHPRVASGCPAVDRARVAVATQGKCA